MILIMDMPQNDHPITTKSLTKKNDTNGAKQKTYDTIENGQTNKNVSLHVETNLASKYKI